MTPVCFLFFVFCFLEGGGVQNLYLKKLLIFQIIPITINFMIKTQAKQRRITRGTNHVLLFFLQGSFIQAFS